LFHADADWNVACFEHNQHVLVAIDRSTGRPQEMASLVGSADIYITPYRYEAQAVSGTLAYAMGKGKAIISTPYWYATEVLADSRGVLIPFDDSAAIVDSVTELLDNESALQAMRKRAHLYARGMVWDQILKSYMHSFRSCRRQPLAPESIGARAHWLGTVGFLA
jgi:glycosyltransferase involved in cell wall biosynthesis